MSKTPQQLYDEMVAAMEQQGAKASKMFGMPCLKNEKGKAFAGYFNGDVTFKLPANIIKEWNGQPGVKLFDPMDGRPMKEWLQMNAAYAEKWPELAKEAYSYVNSLKK